MPPRMQIAMITTCCAEVELDAVDLRQEEHGDALEQRGAVLVHRRAGGEHEAATCGGSLRFSSATLSAVGSVALDDAVENAVSIATPHAAEELARRMPPKKRTESE